jgi:hypothetical protein
LCTYRVSLQCDFSCASSIHMNLRMPVHTKGFSPV